MTKPVEYREFSRKKFSVLMAVLVCIFGAGTWMTLDSLAAYMAELENLAEIDPACAAEKTSRLLRILAGFNGILLLSLSVLILVHGWRGRRTATMPPRGSWILAGQRTWSGEAAVRIAGFTIVAGILLGVLALASSATLWYLSAGFADKSVETCVQ